MEVADPSGMPAEVLHAGEGVCRRVLDGICQRLPVEGRIRLKVVHQRADKRFIALAPADKFKLLSNVKPLSACCKDREGSPGQPPANTLLGSYDFSQSPSRPDLCPGVCQISPLPMCSVQRAFDKQMKLK